MKFFVFVSTDLKPDWRSKSVMLATRVPYSHAGIIVGDTVYHATRFGVWPESVSDFLRTHSFAHRIDVTEFVLDPSYALGWCHGSIGKDYSESQLVAWAIKPLRRFGFFNDGKREMICSELATRFIVECTSMPVFRDVDADFIDPVLFIETILRFYDTKN